DGGEENLGGPEGEGRLQNWTGIQHSIEQLTSKIREKGSPTGAGALLDTAPPAPHRNKRRSWRRHPGSTSRIQSRPSSLDVPSQHLQQTPASCGTPEPYWSPLASERAEGVTGASPV